MGGPCLLGMAERPSGRLSLASTTHNAVCVINVGTDWNKWPSAAMASLWMFLLRKRHIYINHVFIIEKVNEVSIFQSVVNEYWKGKWNCDEREVRNTSPSLAHRTADVGDSRLSKNLTGWHGSNEAARTHKTRVNITKGVSGANVPPSIHLHGVVLN